MGEREPQKSVWAKPPRPGVSADRDKADIDRQETHELTYLVARDEWLAEHAPQLERDAPSHECSFLVPGAAYGDELHFDELDDQGLRCGARWLSRGRYAFGTPSEVIAAVAGAEVEDGWVEAAVRAIRTERVWGNRSRRATLEVWKGDGELVHITASVNRPSIQRWGLDSSRMGAARGIAGSTRPEVSGVFLDTIDSVGFFKSMAREPVDLWAVDVSGLWVENGPDGWYIHTSPIGPDRLRRLDGEWAQSPGRIPSFISSDRS